MEIERADRHVVAWQCPVRFILAVAPQRLVGKGGNKHYGHHHEGQGNDGDGPAATMLRHLLILSYIWIPSNSGL
jgi:hypothetical protein